MPTPETPESQPPARGAPGSPEKANGGDSAKDRETQRREAPRLDADQTTADADQTAADLDQTSADREQQLADRNQQQANLDQAASDADQATADREAAAHPERQESSAKLLDTSRQQRGATTIAREETTLAPAEASRERNEQATRRDHNAHLRDLTAQARDLAAEALDRAAAEQEQAHEAQLSSRDRNLHRAALEYMGDVREDAAQIRRRAADDRAAAAVDRERAAKDREVAAADRAHAQAQLRLAHLDDLTGAYQRGIGMVALEHELDRARRNGTGLVLGFVDVDELKAVNDADGHAAGDALLRAVGNAMRSKMRSYEPIVRFGGDEFVCSLGDVDVDEAQARFEEIRTALVADGASGTIGVGLALMEPDESLDELIARADAALIESRR